MQSTAGDGEVAAVTVEGAPPPLPIDPRALAQRRVDEVFARLRAMRSESHAAVALPQRLGEGQGQPVGEDGPTAGNGR